MIRSLFPINRLIDFYRLALREADPMEVLPAHLPKPPQGRTVVIGMGKAAAAMARAVEKHWPGPLSGVIVVQPDARWSLTRIEQVEGNHPVPADLVLALVSGGGSALCAVPAPSLALEEKQQITRLLLTRGATIHQINTVRKHVSLLKGGRLAAQAHLARVVLLLVSDIPCDDPTLVASGPTLADPTTCDQALRVLEQFDVVRGARGPARRRTGLGSAYPVRRDAR